MATGYLTRQLAENIAIKRKQMGLTQAQIAERISVEKETISRMESGKVAITLDRVEQFAKIFHCAARRKRNIHADSDAVLCSHIWSNFV